MIEGNERVYFDDEFRKIEQTIGQLVTALNYNLVTGFIASGVVTLPASAHLLNYAVIDTEAAGATDDLDTITSTQSGKVLVVSAANSSRTVVLKDGTGNLKLAGDCTLDNVEDSITLIKFGDDWIELARSNNGA